MVNIISTNSPNVDGFNYKELDDDGIVSRVILEKSWGDIQNRSDLWKVMTWLSGHNMTTESKKPQWTLGDEENRTLTLSAGFILPATDGLKVTVNVDETYVSDNQLIYVYEDLGATYGISAAVLR